MGAYPTQRDVEALVLAIPVSALRERAAVARAVLTSDWYAERIAQARREAWDEGWLIGFSNCTGTAGGRTANPYRPDTWGNHMGDAPADAPAALRGDA